MKTEPLSIRSASPEDLERCAAIESACFPPEQAASREDLRRRLAAYPDHILVGEFQGTIAGYIMGPVIDRLYIEDSMFADTGCHHPGGAYQAVFSLAVLPEFRRRGFGGQLIRAMAGLAEREGRRAVTLTCRDFRVPYYASFGFQDHGLAASVHGGVPWHNMVLTLTCRGPAA